MGTRVSLPPPGRSRHIAQPFANGWSSRMKGITARGMALLGHRAISALGRVVPPKRKMVKHRSWIWICQPSRMNEAPHDRARGAQPENDSRAGLNAKTPPVFAGGLRITGHVKDAAGDPDQAQHGGDGIADI